MRDRRGRRTYNYQTYQVTVAEIEEKTGLDFPEVLAERNPLFFNPSDTAVALNVTSFPERREVNSRIDIVRDNANPRALDFADDEVDVFIAAAMINPRGDERAGEWVSIINLGSAPENLDGWTLRDGEGRRKELSGTLDIGEAIRIGDLGAVRFANNRDGFVQLVDNRDRQIDRVPYTKAQAQREGKPIIFAYRELDYDAAGS
jgi:endonuclease G